MLYKVQYFIQVIVSGPKHAMSTDMPLELRPEDMSCLYRNQIRDLLASGVKCEPLPFINANGYKFYH